MQYTEKELSVIKAGFIFNYDTAEAEKSDNASHCDISYASSALKTPKKVLSGVCVSLYNKGLLQEDEVNGDPYYRITDFGIDEYYRLEKLGFKNYESETN